LFPTKWIKGQSLLKTTHPKMDTNNSTITERTGKYNHDKPLPRKWIKTLALLQRM
jgi:hypothetical protein